MTNSEVKDFIKEKAHSLQHLYDDDEARNIIDILAESTFKISRTDLIVKDSFNLSDNSIQKFNQQVELLKSGVPVQHIIGEVQFADARIKVNSNVLIPRPETEELVNMCYQDFKNQQGLNILDLCTGSGCIAISLAQQLNGKVTALDVSTEALSIARDNAALNKVNVDFQLLNILEEGINGKYDIIISNPPYVLASEKSLMHKNVLEYEPHLALFVDDSDALIFYERILQICKNNLKESGKVYLEINEAKGNEMNRLYCAHFNNVEIHVDLFGKERFLTAY